MSIEALNAEIERRKAKAAAAPMKNVTTVAAEISGIMSKMERLQNLWTEHCAEFERDFDDLCPVSECPNHLGSLLDKDREATMQESWKFRYFKPVYAACGLCQADEAGARLRRLWSRRGLPERVMGATFDNFECATAEQTGASMKVQNWLSRNGVFLLLLGTTGTGKGHLAAACLKAHGSGKFITHADMLMDLRTSYELHDTEKRIAEWQDAEMLVLDEFGIRSDGKDEAPMLYQVLAERYDKRRPTIITSNLELPEVKEILGHRLCDRIAEDYAIVICRWQSHRKAAA